MLAACLAGPAFAGSPGDFAETASPAAAKGDRLPMGDADRLPVLVTAAEPQDTFLANLGRGRLVVDGNGCLRHGDAFVVWTYGSRISRTGDGRIEVVDGVTGKAVLVGQEIGMSGAAGDAVPDPDRLAGPIPPECGAPYKWGGPVVTEAELREQDEKRRNRVPVPVPPEAERTIRQ
jgi:hypothetical protein